jgi:hypothetical protein
MKTFVLLALLPLTAIAEPASKATWTDLLANDSLEQWQQPKLDGPDKIWLLENGILRLDQSRKGKKNGKENDNLLTKKNYDSFELKFEWKISEQGNSGVKYRTKGGLGLEYQIIDDKSKAATKPSQRAGGLYDLVAAPDDKALKPVGEWNSSRIVAKDNHLEHWLNGVKTVEIEYGSPDWIERFGKSKYRKNSSFASKPGPLLLQDHGNNAWFRKLFIREL